MIWLIAPLLITMFLVQVYFGRHKEEEIGWNTAYGNSIVLIFTTITLFHYLYNTFGYQAMIAFEGTAFYKSLFVGIGLVYAFLLMFIDFIHLLPKKLAFFLSNSITISVSAFVAVVLVYSDVPFDLVTLVTAICLFLIVLLFFKLFRWIIPASKHAEEVLKRRGESEEARDAEKKLERYRKAKHMEDHIKEEVGDFAEKTKESLQSFKKLFKK